MPKTYIKIFLDVDNPDGDEIAFETEDPKQRDFIIKYLKTMFKAVVPE